MVLISKTYLLTDFADFAEGCQRVAKWNQFDETHRTGGIVRALSPLRGVRSQYRCRSLDTTTR